MCNESYEDYIRSILGYPNYHENNRYENYAMSTTTNFANDEQKAQLEACYPEIYKIVYPMVNKACSNNVKPVTSELIDQLTNEIYVSIENDSEINVTINLNNEVGNNRNHTGSVMSSTKAETPKENRGESRQFRNRGLQDLIRILLIRELLGRPGRHPGNRPPMPPQRPPMRPPFPGPRPPIMPRISYSDNEDLYE